MTSKNSKFQKCNEIIDLLLKIDQSDSIMGLDHYPTISSRENMIYEATWASSTSDLPCIFIDFGEFLGKYDDIEISKSKKYFFGEKKNHSDQKKLKNQQNSEFRYSQVPSLLSNSSGARRSKAEKKFNFFFRSGQHQALDL